MTAESAMPLEHFIQAVQSQLDNAQTAMAVKAQNLNLPLTFAIKDVTLDLRAHVELARSEIRIRPAGPADADASVFHLVFAAITRPMIEENAVAFGEDPAERSIEDLGDELSEEERRRLEWIGVRTVEKLKEVRDRGAERTVRRVTALPVDRLRQALKSASKPLAERIVPVERRAGEPSDGPGLLRIAGRNLRGGGLPRVTIGDEPVSVVRADEREIVIAPRAHQTAGELRVEVDPGVAATLAFDLRPFFDGPGPEDRS
jgi:hypothetical protein